MKTGTVALVVRLSDKPTSLEPQELVDFFCDDRELEVLEALFSETNKNPLEALYDYRAQLHKEEEEFGDYVESLLVQPFVRDEVRTHGLEWLKSKLRIDAYRKNELAAAKVIAEYAFKVYQEDPSRMEFLLAGSQSKVLVRTYLLKGDESIPSGIPGKIA